VFCNQCGSQLDSQSKFCSSCGSPVLAQTKTRSSSQKEVVSFGTAPDARWDPETDIALWVANVATGKSKSAEGWGTDVLAIYQRVLEGTPRWASFTELFKKDQSQLFQLLTVDDLRALDLSDVLVLTLQEASHVVDDPVSRIKHLETWLDCRDWVNVPGITSRDSGRLEFVRAFMYAINNLSTDETFLNPLSKSLSLGFGPAALPIAEEFMYSRSDLENAVTTLIEGKEAGSAACSDWLEELEDAPGEYSGTVSDENGNEEIAFVSFNAGGFGTMPEK
jgi:hypothetical protein